MLTPVSAVQIVACRNSSRHSRACKTQAVVCKLRIYCSASPWPHQPCLRSFRRITHHQYQLPLREAQKML